MEASIGEAAESPSILAGVTSGGFCELEITRAAPVSEYLEDYMRKFGCSTDIP